MTLLPDSTTDKLRRKALSALEEFEATAYLVAPPDVDTRRQLDERRSRVESSTKQQLRALIAGAERQIAQVRAQYRITASPVFLKELWSKVKASSPGHCLVMPLYIIRELVPDWDRIMGGTDDLPPHARIGLDATGTMYDRSRHPEVYLLEAIMFEDAASLYNLAAVQTQQIRDTSAKQEVKRAAALCRASLVASITFLEAYLNAIAFDYLSLHDDTVDDATRSLLGDWDFQRQRPKYLSLRDKLSAYQRILLGTQHAPLQESNTPEIAYVLGIAKTVRDAVAHPSPAVNASTYEPEKERAVFGVDLSTAAQTIDAAIRLVRRLDALVSPHPSRLFWLHDREADGLFPPEVFD